MDRIQQIQKSSEATLKIRLPRRGFVKTLAIAAGVVASSVYDQGDQGGSDSSSEGPQTQDILVESNLLGVKNFFNRVLSGSSRVARAEGLTVAKTEVKNASCGNGEAGIDITVPDFNFCPKPDQALIYATSIIYKETNSQARYQKDQDKVTGLHVGATYTMRNTAKPEESYEVIVNQKGEISRTVELPDGKKVEQTVFLFTADPNSTPHKAENGGPAVEIEFRRQGAYDIGTKTYGLGDPVKAYSALGCTALDYGLRLEERFLAPEAKPVPATEAPKPPVILPPVQLPRSGDGSTPIETNPNIPRWPGQ